MNMDLLAPLVAWPAMLLAAWLAGEWIFRRYNLPRVCAYGAVGLLLGVFDLSQGIASHNTRSFVANVALSLMLFELGYRINLRWFRHNPWVLAAGVLQGPMVFGAVFYVSSYFSIPIDHRLVLAALCVASSPAAITRITNELRSAGQVTERVLHLCALNCLMAVLLFKLVVGYWHLETSGDLQQAAYKSVYVIFISLGMGAALGVVAPWLNRLSTSGGSTTLTFAFLVLLLTGLAQSGSLSPLLAALAFGVVARERRMMLSHAQRNFGALGDMLAVFLFVYIGSLLSWNGLLTGLLLGLSALLVRSGVHVLVNCGMARASGTTFRKGALTGLALMPMSVFAVLLLEESRVYGFELARQSLPSIVGLLMVLDIIGPLITQRALIAAGEADPEPR